MPPGIIGVVILLTVLLISRSIGKSHDRESREAEERLLALISIGEKISAAEFMNRYKEAYKDAEPILYVVVTRHLKSLLDQDRLSKEGQKDGVLYHRLT